MSVILGKAGCFWHGLMPVKPKLPRGWEYYEDADNWLFAKSPDGQWWFAGPSALIKCNSAGWWDVIRTLPNRFRRHKKAFRLGEMFVGKKQKELHPAIILNADLEAAMKLASVRAHEAYVAGDTKTWWHWLNEADRLDDILIQSHETIHGR